MRSDGDTARATLADLRQRIAQLEHEKRKLTDMLRFRDDFLTQAAHELRNPMTPIIGQVQLLRRQVQMGALAPAQIEASLGRLESVILRYIKRATTLLDVSRISSGRLRLRPVRVPLGPLIAEVAEELRAQATQAGASITIAVPDSITATLDRLAVEQVLDNLLTNAVKYGDGTPIDVSATVRPGENGTVDIVHIRVADGGRGIAPEDQARIFERFERVAGSARRGGFGVGLWIVRELVEAMGGAVRLSSMPGQGAAFTVTLPLHPPAGDPMKHP